MQDSDKTPHSIRFQYEDAADYRLIYSTGAQGGVMPNGLIKFDMYVEFHTSPSAEMRSLLGNGQLGDTAVEGQATDAIRVTRRREIGVVMNAHDVRSLAKWLQEKADEADTLREAVVKAKDAK
jgi:4-hydroxyphenylpyruvate dioxygenase-like putative hemolysin